MLDVDFTVRFFVFTVFLSAYSGFRSQVFFVFLVIYVVSQTPNNYFWLLRNCRHFCRLLCMQSTTIRVRPETHKALARLAKENHSSMQNVLNEALEAYRRKVFLQRANQAYAELRNDPAAWSHYQKEMKAWDGTTEDGL
jgi:predicted transcriptional regulator